MIQMPPDIPFLVGNAVTELASGAGSNQPPTMGLWRPALAAYRP